MNVKFERVEPFSKVLRGVRVCPVVENTLSSAVCDAGIAKILAATFCNLGNRIASFQNFKMSNCSSSSVHYKGTCNQIPGTTKQMGSVLG